MKQIDPFITKKYEELRKAQFKRSKKIERYITIFTAFGVGLPLVSLIYLFIIYFIVAFDSNAENDEFVLIWLSFLIDSIPWLLLIAVTSYVKNYAQKRSKKYINRLISTKNGVEVTNNSEIATMIKKIKEFASESNIKATTKVYLVDDYSYFPSLEKVDKNYIILIPINFISLYSKSPDAAFSLLIHEIGHIRHRDFIFWDYATTFRRLGSKLIIPVMLLIISLWVLAIAIFPENYVEGSETGIVIRILVILYFPIFARQVAIGRKNAEKLADIFSYLYSDGDSLINTIELYSSQTNTGKYHGKNMKRIKQLKTFFNK